MTTNLIRTCVIASALALVPLAGLAQEPATAADAAKFIGDWSLMLDTPNGSMPMDLKLKAAEGKVTAEAGSEATGVTPITDITKSGESLVLRYLIDFQGTPVPITITLTPAGEKMGFFFDAADGQFTLEGAATKK